MTSIHVIKRFTAIAVAASCIGAASGVDDCCTALNTTNSFRNKTLGNDWCASNWVSTQRHDGKVCLPIGTGYACGSQRTLEVGEEYTLSGAISIGGGGGGASIGASTTFTVSEQTTHTAGNCESCQFFASYGNATLREWTVSSFYVIGADTQKKRTTLQKRGAPTIMPCCETNNNCSGCPEGQTDGSWPAITDPIAWGADGGGEGSPDEITYIIDLRNPEFYSGTWPAWHPMNSPGTTFDTLNCWQVWEIIRELGWVSMLESAPITE
ncbi:MAG: hypothetical protein K8E66_05575, partial [Phycisphaerales bacterium]|nr:hypothetical protein [Phycisphaerales bacterium]